jgi:hypothetical protein
MEADFGCVCFIRCILKGCRGQIYIWRQISEVDFNMEAVSGGSFNKEAGFGGSF